MTMLILIAVLSANPDKGQAMAADDWRALSITDVGADDKGSPYVRVQAADLDGDGSPDDAVVKLTCDGARLTAADYTITSPRDSSSGMASGKRAHNPIRFVKQWDKATPQLSAMKPTYDVKKVEGSGARTAADGWKPIALASSDGLCDAARKATKTRSNIQNN